MLAMPESVSPAWTVEGLRLAYLARRARWAFGPVVRAVLVVAVGAFVPPASLCTTE